MHPPFKNKPLLIEFSRGFIKNSLNPDRYDPASDQEISSGTSWR